MNENNNYYYQAPPQQTPPPQNGNNQIFLEDRSVALCIILSIVTCGLYMWYWRYKMVDELNAASKDPAPTSGGTVLVLSLITCNIYGLIWLYKAGQQMNAAKLQRGMLSDSSLSIVYLVLAIFGLRSSHMLLYKTI
jgi:hypothetical protein